MCAFVEKLVHEGPEGEYEKINLEDVPALPSDTVAALTRDELEEIARQYVEGHKHLFRKHTENANSSIEQLKGVFVDKAGRVKERQGMFGEIHETLTKSLFGDRGYKDIVGTQKLIDEMQDYRSQSSLDLIPIEMPSLEPYQDTTQQDILDELRQQKGLQDFQSDILVSMNTSMVSMNKATANRAAAAEKEASQSFKVAMFSIGVATLSLAVTAYFSYKNDERSELAAIEQKASAEEVKRLIEAASDQLIKATEQGQQGADETSALLAELVELKKQELQRDSDESL